MNLDGGRDIACDKCGCDVHGWCQWRCECCFGEWTDDNLIFCRGCIEPSQKDKWYCYILRSTIRPNITYNGMTNNPKRRIRQHNREIKGGAKATGKHGPYEMYCLIGGLENKIDAMRCEWRIKYPTGGKRKHTHRGQVGRIKGLLYGLELDRWTSKCTKDSCETPLTIWIVKDKSHLLLDAPDYVRVVAVDKIDFSLLD